ncbi:hypothetical protein IWX49DRAFT_556562 [Phyllosticta citricarpa]|uniref:Uncharacterized protein n=2 Tax=Phyllosticta TaxID=121621 RepID=A0ABR1LLJ5_9PEZI
MSANTMERPAENTRASEANIPVPLNPAIFESESKEQQIGLSEILLDAAVIIQIYEWMPQPQRKTPTTLLASWSLENEQHLQSTQRVWASIKARHPCCLQRRAVNDAARAADNTPVPKHNYRHRECARLAKYWRQQVRLRAVRHSNLGIALSMVRNEVLDLGSQGHLKEPVQRLVEGEPVQALEDCGEKLRELGRPITSASAPSTSSSLPPRETKSVSFSPDVLLFGQRDDARSRKSFQRHHADYVPGRWSLREVRGRAASQVQEQPEAATPITSSPGEPMDFDPMEIDPPSTPTTTCSSSSSLDDDSSNDTDTFLDTSGRFQSFEAFYHHHDDDDYNTASMTSLDHHDNQRTTTTT